MMPKAEGEDGKKKKVVYENKKKKPKKIDQESLASSNTSVTSNESKSSDPKSEIKDSWDDGVDDEIGIYLPFIYVHYS